MYTSRLSKSLADVFNDKQAIGYLLQFMDVHNVKHLVQFWLDAESFRATAVSRISILARANESLPVTNLSTPSTDTRRLNGGAPEAAPSSVVNPDRAAKNRLPGVNIDDKLGSVNAANVQNQNNSSRVPFTNSASGANCTNPVSSDSVDRVVSLSANNNHTSAERSAQNGLGSTNYNPHESSASSTLRRLPSEKDLDFRLRLQKSIEKDAVAVFSRYIAHDAPQPIGVTEQLRNEAISRICSENNQVDIDCFVSCQQFVVNVINNEYFPSFKESVYYLRHQADILTRCDVTLRDILYNQSALFYLTEFMEREGARTLFQCWSDLESFRQLLHSQQPDDPSSAAQIQDDAIIIYDRYFSLQALNPIGFPDTVRQEVENHICAENGVQPGCFDTAHRIVMQRMDRDYFQQFLKSDVFVRFLSDLVSSVQSLIASPASRVRKRQASDAGSVHSSSSTGDAVVVTSPSASASAAAASAHAESRLQKAMSRVQDDMKIDDHLFQPESLWRRPNVGAMSLGKVDKLGRFISEVDPEPDVDKKKKAPFFKMNLFKDQAAQNDEEEMAHQIADMIIREVTYVTK